MKSIAILFFVFIVLLSNCGKTARPAADTDSNSASEQLIPAPDEGDEAVSGPDSLIVSEEDISGGDTTLIRMVDLTGDSVVDTIMLNLHLSSWNEPVTWELYIFHDCDTLFKVMADDSRIDRFYGDPEFMYQCGSYLECKKKWYLEQLIDFPVEKLEPGNERREFFLTFGKHYAEMEDSEYGPTQEEALANWQWLCEHYADKPMVHFRVRSALESSTASMTFHPKLGKFVPLYHP